MKKYSNAEIEIVKDINVNVSHMGNEICFVCTKINLDAIYNIEAGKITGKGSKACREFIVAESKKILDSKN